MTQTAKQVVPLSRGVAAAARCRPFLDKAQTSFLAAAKKIGAEYAALPTSEKAIFRLEIKLARTSIQNYKLVATHADAKLAIIKKTNGGGLSIPESLRTWLEICRTPNHTLRSATKKGLFRDHEVTAEAILRFRRTGALPGPRRTHGKPLTTLALIKHHLHALEKLMTQTGGRAYKLRALMEREGVSHLKGPEVELLRDQFDVVLSEIIEISPGLFNNVKKVIQKKLT